MFHCLGKKTEAKFTALIFTQIKGENRRDEEFCCLQKQQEQQKHVLSMSGHDAKSGCLYDASC